MQYPNFGKVSQMRIKPIASNMTELVLNDGTQVLFSYETPVACKLNHNYYRTSYKWSKTTSRHINKWLDGVQAIQADQGFFNDLVNGSFIHTQEA
jgi:hypothetical protein